MVWANSSQLHEPISYNCVSQFLKFSEEEKIFKSSKMEMVTNLCPQNISSSARYRYNYIDYRFRYSYIWYRYRDRYIISLENPNTPCKTIIKSGKFAGEKHYGTSILTKYNILLEMTYRKWFSCIHSSERSWLYWLISDFLFLFHKLYIIYLPQRELSGLCGLGLYTSKTDWKVSSLN